jgi:methylated-DNA-[protein]-cysteine S-methyltransferase
MPSYTLCTPEHVHRGSLTVSYEGEEVIGIDLLPSMATSQPPRNAFERNLKDQFEGYFADAGYRFDVALRLRGTPYQRRVWEALRDIPAGGVRSYGQLAAQLDSSPRAVGNACRRNPVPIIVPCHRVVARSGIGGFGGAASGDLVEQKRRLLQHEGVAM